ncbi:hypothetical protein QAD02_022386 [Eretmocerus hayati]|uniref:Uncharacterized protein n=1 Tax=Eretmocerus hayati TaxID=131215 RepID=A0ACC2PW65_9HYME|nr:hypothetical protein QAD02_022386 [Eretmocerus hayati]
MAAIYKGSEFICPGAILSTNYIITSASCAKKISDDKESKYMITVGSSELGKSTSEHAIDFAKPHEEYVHDKGYTQNDIGLVHTTESIFFGTTSQTIELYNGNFEYVNAEIVGWGGDSQGRMNNELQSLSVPIFASNDCNGRYHYLGKYITYEQICAGNEKQGQSGLCMKDEGTPLVINGKLAGIATWYLSCASSLPDVYTWIPSHLEWISKNLHQDSNHAQAEAVLLI